MRKVEKVLKWQIQILRWQVQSPVREAPHLPRLLLGRRRHSISQTHTQGDLFCFLFSFFLLQNLCKKSCKAHKLNNHPHHPFYLLSNFFFKWSVYFVFHCRLCHHSHHHPHRHRHPRGHQAEAFWNIFISESISSLQFSLYSLSSDNNNNDNNNNDNNDNNDNNNDNKNNNDNNNNSNKKVK